MALERAVGLLPLPPLKDPGRGAQGARSTALHARADQRGFPPFSPWVLPEWTEMSLEVRPCSAPPRQKGAVPWNRGLCSSAWASLLGQGLMCS